MEDFDALQVAIDEATLSDVDGIPTLAATGLVTFARIPGTAASGVDDYDPAGWLGQIRHRRVDTPSGRTITSGWASR